MKKRYALLAGLVITLAGCSDQQIAAPEIQFSRSHCPEGEVCEEPIDPPSPACQHVLDAVLHGANIPGDVVARLCKGDK